MIEKALVRVKDLEVRTTFKSDDVSSAQLGISDERTKIQLRREITEVSSAVKVIAQKVADDHDGMTKGLAGSNAGVEKLKGAMRKIVEIVNSERQEHRETTKVASRNEKAAVETEISMNRRFEKISGEIIELRRDLIEGSTQSKAASGAKGPDSDENEKLGGEGNGGEIVLYRKLGNLESRLHASKSASSRQDATIQGHVAELRGEMSELRASCRTSRGSSKNPPRSRSASAEPTGQSCRDSILGGASDTALSSSIPFLCNASPGGALGDAASVAFTILTSSNFSLVLVVGSPISHRLPERTSSNSVMRFWLSSLRPTRSTILSFNLPLSLVKSAIAMSTRLTSRCAAFTSSRNCMFSLVRFSTRSVSRLVSSIVFPVEAKPGASLAPDILVVPRKNVFRIWALKFWFGAFFWDSGLEGFWRLIKVLACTSSPCFECIRICRIMLHKLGGILLLFTQVTQRSLKRRAAASLVRSYGPLYFLDV